MDFGLLGMEGLVGHHQQQQNSGSSDQDGKRKCNGSGSRSGSIEKDDTFRVSKMARNDLDLGISKAMAFQQQQEILNPVMRSTGSQMLSFSSPSPVYSRNAGYASGSMHGSSFTGIRGPFTPAQWIELEHQALIYKYFTANVPVPATLLVPISRAFNLSGFSGFPAGSFPAHSYGWGPFHLGYSNSTDPEPGRCRRTDGKKWRCSRDAVPDQKYCERHINRGRHRSRKPVEGQTGQAASAPTNAKVAPMSSAVSSNNLALPPHQLKGLQAAVSNLETNPVVNRLQDSQGSSVMPTIHNLKSKDSPFSIPKQQYPFEESVQSEFGFVSNESLLNPSSKTSYMNCKNYNSFSEFNDQPTQDPNPVHHFIDDWQPKDHSNRSNLTWPEELKSDWTQLSMSIPMSGLSSSSTNQEKIALSSLRLSRELDQNVPSEVVTEHGNWIPVSWGSSLGGPLGEVVNKSGDAIGSGKNTSPLNLMSEGRDENKNSDDLLAVSAHAALSSIPAL